MGPQAHPIEHTAFCSKLIAWVWSSSSKLAEKFTNKRRKIFKGDGSRLEGTISKRAGAIQSFLRVFHSPVNENLNFIKGYEQTIILEKVVGPYVSDVGAPALV